MGNFYMEATQINYRRDEKLKTVDQKLQELSETSAIDTDIAPVFKSTNTYQPGDMVYYRNKLYVFNVEHTGAWAAADVTATDVTTELSSLKSGLTDYQTQNDLNLEVPERINLFDKDNKIIEYKYYDGTSWHDVSAGTWQTIFVPVIGGLTYTASGFPAQGGVKTVITTGDKTTVLADFSAADNNQTYTTPSNAEYIGFGIYSPNANYDSAQFELGSTATTFAPYIPSVESRIEAVDFGILPNAVNYLPSVTIDACQLWKNGKVVNGNIKFTTSETIASGNYILSGMPKISTSAANGAAMGSVSFNKNGAFGALANTQDGTYGAVFVTTELAAGTYCASFSYISV